MVFRFYFPCIQFSRSFDNRVLRSFLCAKSWYVRALAESVKLKKVVAQTRRTEKLLLRSVRTTLVFDGTAFCGCCRRRFAHDCGFRRHPTEKPNSCRTVRMKTTRNKQLMFLFCHKNVTEKYVIRKGTA